MGWLVAMRYGIARGVYANEAGYGTAAVAYGTAKSERPVQQGLNAVIEVFIVSFVTSTISALTILLTGVWQSGLTSSAAVAAAFDTAMPGVGGYIVAFCAFLFGYTTLIGWAYYGEQFFEYILGRKVTVPYRWIYCALIPFGAISRVEVVWAWGDLMNALQVFPNVIGLIGLSGVVARIARQANWGRGIEDRRLDWRLSEAWHCGFMWGLPIHCGSPDAKSSTPRNSCDTATPSPYIDNQSVLCPAEPRAQCRPELPASVRIRSLT